MQFSMLLPFFKFLHVLCGVSFLGIVIAAFFYIARSVGKQDRSLIAYSIRTSYFGDAIIFVCIATLFITSFPLVSAGHFTRAVPWIFVAYHAFGVLVLLWLLNVGVKKYYFSRAVISRYAIRSVYILHAAMICIFMLIIHDAVTHSTWFEFMWRK